MAAGAMLGRREACAPLAGCGLDGRSYTAARLLRTHRVHDERSLREDDRHPPGGDSHPPSGNSSSVDAEAPVTFL
jgi:hypothetical protein